MSRIGILDKKTANSIKAGEVIERPASVVKELFDNAVDSGADRITVSYENGGISCISVTDNGIGMDEEDAKLAFLLHATSKISTLDDLYKLTTMGFRGEALPSIAACSRVTLITKQSNALFATKVVYEDSILQSVEECSSDIGTTVIVRDLFYNIPARYKFLKKDATEGSYICSLIEKLSVVNPNISVKLVKDKSVLLNTPGNGSVLDTIYSVYGKSIASMVTPIDFNYEGIKVKGYTSLPELVRGNRAMQHIYVNDRPIKSSTVSSAIDEAYRNILMKGKHPICFIMIYVDPSEVDCNIHPQKSEVKLTNESSLFRAVFHAITNAIDLTRNKEKISTNEDSLLDIIVSDSESSNSAITHDVKTDFDLTNSTNKSNNSNTHSVNGMRDYSKTSSPSQLEIRASNNLLNILSGIESTSCNDKSETATEGQRSDSVELVETVMATSSEFATRINSDVEILINSRVIGTIFATYILLQSDDSLFLLDQHAAHERVLYEKLLNKRRNDSSNKKSEQLLIPEILSFSASDYSFVIDNISSLNAYGFEVEPIGDRDIALRSVPLMNYRLKHYSDMFIDLISELRKEVPTGNDEWYKSIATAACKAAIKGHDLITSDEVKSLLNSMLELEDPYHCPHGRPTFIKLTNNDIEKMFKRIV